MSIEDAINANTVALRELAESFCAMAGAIKAVKPASAGSSSEPQPVPARRGRPTKEPVQTMADLAPTAAGVVTAVTYEAVRDQVLACVGDPTRGHAAALAVLEKFGVKSAMELKPEQYADVIEAFK
jgi:hypothetical protein